MERLRIPRAAKQNHHNAFVVICWNIYISSFSFLTSPSSSSVGLNSRVCCVFARWFFPADFPVFPSDLWWSDPSHADRSGRHVQGWVDSDRVITGRPSKPLPALPGIPTKLISGLWPVLCPGILTPELSTCTMNACVTIGCVCKCPCLKHDQQQTRGEHRDAVTGYPRWLAGLLFPHADRFMSLLWLYSTVWVWEIHTFNYLVTSGVCVTENGVCVRVCTGKKW